MLWVANPAGVRGRTVECGGSGTSGVAGTLISKVYAAANQSEEHCRRGWFAERFRLPPPCVAFQEDADEGGDRDSMAAAVGPITAVLTTLAEAVSHLDTVAASLAANQRKQIGTFTHFLPLLEAILRPNRTWMDAPRGLHNITRVQSIDSCMLS